jgi:DnaJ-class molecular chaperone
MSPITKTRPKKKFQACATCKGGGFHYRIPRGVINGWESGQVYETCPDCDGTGLKGGCVAVH